MIRKRAKHISLIILLLAVSAFQGFAQKSFTPAIISSEKVLWSSEEGKKAAAQLLEKEQKINTELAGIDKQVLSLETKLKTQKLILSFESQQQLALDLDRLRTKRKRVEEDLAKDYQQLQFSLVTKIRNEVLPIINSVAKEKEFSLVLDLTSSGVVYFDPAFDITDEVIKRYNASKAAKK